MTSWIFSRLRPSASMTIIKSIRLSWFVSRGCFTSEAEDGEWRGKRKCSCAGPEDCAGRRMRRQEMRCEGYCGAMLSALLTAPCPRLVTAIHMRSTVTLCSMVSTRRGDGNQALNSPNLIGEATLNVPQPGGHRAITAVGKERLHI